MQSSTTFRSSAKNVSHAVRNLAHLLRKHPIPFSFLRYQGYMGHGLVNVCHPQLLHDYALQSK